MLDQFVNAGLVIVLALFLVWMVVTLATGVTLNGLF